MKALQRLFRQISYRYILICLILFNLGSWCHANEDAPITNDEEQTQHIHMEDIPVEIIKEESVLTEDEIKAKSLYDNAMEILSKPKSDHSTAYMLLETAANLGHQESQEKVGWARLFGKTISQNISRAEELFEELSNVGNPEGQMGLGFMYATGVGKNSSQAKALVYYEFGALGGSSWAQMALGYRYWAGVGVGMSCERALSYYRKVASKVADQVSPSGGKAIQRVRLLDEADMPSTASSRLDDDLMQYYQLLAEKGDMQAQLALGQLHYQGGRGVDQDHARALNYFMQAAEAGSAHALAFLGKMYMEGSSVVKQDNDTAFWYFKKAADQNNSVGQSGLGLMYLHGRSVRQDYKMALKYFSLAAKQGWVDGQLQLGNMYYAGLGVQRDYKMAVKYFNLASHSGHILATFNLAEMQASGIGLLRTCHTAVELYKSVAERGKWAELMMEAHSSFWNGDTSESLVRYLLLGELGYEVAQSNAAFILDRHDNHLFNEEQSYSRGLMYWGRAASQGYDMARVKLGDYHYYGFGTNVDYELAAAHYRIASEQQHNAQAFFNLGYMHEQGLGLKKDMYLAKRFYDLAADSSTDAQVPVALALLKLGILFVLKYLEEIKWFQANFWSLEPILGSNWDIYLILILSGFVAVLLFLRHPQ